MKWQRLIPLLLLILAFASPCLAVTYHLPYSTIIRNGQKVHFGDYWIYAVSGTNIKITAWFESGWTNYTVYSAGTQQIYNGSKPNTVYINGISKVESDGWSYSSGTVTVTIATTSACLLWSTSTPDTTPPTYSSVAHNTTIAGQPIQFSCSWQDDVALNVTFFSTNNTGAWVNDTVSLSGNPSWANITKTLNDTAGVAVSYLWFCNDTNNNWATTPTYSFTTTALGQNIVVLLGLPSDGELIRTKNVNFTYIPIFYQEAQNSSLWLNLSGSWQAGAWNGTAIQNATSNTITYTFANSGLYVWNIATYNTSQAVFAEFNRTLTVALEPYYTLVSYSDTETSMPCLFSSIWNDGDGLAAFIFGTNNTGVWVNDTAQSLSGLSAVANVTKPLSSMEGTVVSFQFWVNDTDGKWSMSGVWFLTVTAPYGLPPIFPFAWPVLRIDTYMALNMLAVLPLLLTCMIVAGLIWAHRTPPILAILESLGVTGLITFMLLVAMPVIDTLLKAYGL